MENSFEKILVKDEQIKSKIVEMANEINKYYQNSKNVLIVPILDGSIVFAGHLITNLNFDLIVKSTRISLYNSSTSIDKSNINNIKIDFDLSLIKDKEILIVEDLIDTGNTLNILKKFFIEHGARSVKICVLFKKDINPREIEMETDWFGFLVPNQWIAGFGVDCKLKYRNFKNLGIVKKEFQ